MRQITLLIFTLFISSVLSAQDKSSYLLIKGHVVFPQGDFADDDGYKDGFTDIGFGGGLEYQHPIGTEGLGFFISGDVLVNPVNDDKLDAVSINDFRTHYSGPYINIPFMVGLLYSIQLNPTTEFHVKGGGGINYFVPPNFEIRYQGSPYRSYHSESTNSFGFKIAGSFVIDIYLFELSYMYLGEAEYKIKEKGDFSGTVSTLTTKQPVSMINLSIGIRL